MTSEKLLVTGYWQLVTPEQSEGKMAEIKFEGAGATNKERRLARLPRGEAGRSTKILFRGGFYYG